MPFIAIDEKTEELIDITPYDDPKAALNFVNLICQDCSAPFFIRSGDYYLPHFVHKRGYEDRECYYRTHGESEAHREAKRMLASALRKSGYFGESKISIEHRVETPNGRRYIDVYAESDNGVYAHEIQLSNQSIEKFRERTEAYRKLGIESVWWIGGAAATSENIVWIESNCDYIGTVNVKTYRVEVISERATTR